MFNPNISVSPVLTWDSQTRFLSPAAETRVSVIESTLQLTWQDYLDRKLGWEHPNPSMRMPLLAPEVGVHSCLLPHPEHEEWFIELFGKTTQVHVGSDRYEVDMLQIMLFDEGAPRRRFGFKVRALNARPHQQHVSYDGTKVSCRFLHHSQVLKQRAKAQRKKK